MNMPVIVTLPLVAVSMAGVVPARAACRACLSQPRLLLAARLG